MRSPCCSVEFIIQRKVRTAPFDVPCAAKVLYPRTSVIRVLKTWAVSSDVQLPGAEVEKAIPGRDGMTTLKETG